MEEAQTRILIVDDDEQWCQLVSSYLTQQGFEVTMCHHGNDGVLKILSEQPALVILDLMLPGMDGLSICREVRGEFRGQILMLTALDESTEEITGLELGADDYVTKPVSPRLLLARIRALLRRGHVETAEPEKSRYEVGELVIDRGSRSVTLNRERIRTSSSEFDLIWLLASNSGQVMSRDRLHEAMFRTELMPDDRRIDLLISRLRKKLNDDALDAKVLVTVRGKGYQLAAPGVRG